MGSCYCGSCVFVTERNNQGFRICVDSTDGVVYRSRWKVISWAVVREEFVGARLWTYGKDGWIAAVPFFFLLGSCLVFLLVFKLTFC